MLAHGRLLLYISHNSLLSTFRPSTGARGCWRTANCCFTSRTTACYLRYAIVRGCGGAKRTASYYFSPRTTLCCLRSAIVWGCGGIIPPQRGERFPTDHFERLSQRLSSAMTSAVIKGISSGAASRENASKTTVSCLSKIATGTLSRAMVEERPKNLP